MSVVGALVRTAGFAALFVLAALAGRLTVMEGVGLGLVWPAAGVAVVWFAVQRRAWWPVDAVALTATTIAVNLATGASTALAGASALANLAQVLVVVYLLGRWCPHLRGGGGQAPLTRLADVWRLLAAAALGTVAGAAIGPTAVWLLGGHWSWLTTAVWLTRNTVSILLVGVAGLQLQHLIASHGGLGGWWTVLRRTPHRAGWARVAELVALLVCSTGLYLLAFVANHGLPLAFPLLTVTVWAALRFGITFVICHDLAAGTAATLFTLHGFGPFATVASAPLRGLVVQVFAGVVAVVGLILAISRAERDTATNQLAAAERAASAQARLLAAIVDSMGDGLIVVDENGRVRLRNPAASTVPGDLITAPSVNGLLHADGTPVAAADLPHARALAGQPVRGVDLHVRRPHLPEACILTVTATAIPAETAGGLPSAVVVFRDVTAERRHRDELADFAGVVAHDLLNPLTTVEGWAAVLDERVEDLPEPARREVGGALTRISRAAAHMRHLIKDLLAYTTAREATLATTDLALHDMIADIAAGHTDQAAATGTPTPRFHTGQLHPVHADPLLVRQLLGNLIGNAIKYTAHGATPDVTITSTAADGRIRIEITDQGIGIPSGQHEAIFGTFHRAHQGAYTGTGLGLTICKRIVERHGGTITATDNPTGPGTRIAFTLPAATSSSRTPTLDQSMPVPA